MEAGTEGQDRLGLDHIAGSAPAHIEEARTHRELAIGNFFVTLRKLGDKAHELLHVLVEDEKADLARRQQRR